MAITEGKIPFKVAAETYETYYKLAGDLKDRSRTPLVVVHGGPAFAHDYLLPCADLATAYNMPVIFYDQLGSGQSTVLSEWPPAFWSIDRMIDELENLLSHFNIQDGFNLIGHSWGGVLIAEYAVRRKPHGLRRLVLADSFASMALYNASWAKLLSADDIPASVREGISKGFSDLPVFKAALFEFFAIHGCRVKPIPEDFIKGIEPGFVNTAPYFGIWGGELQGWSIIDRLHEITVPTFVINGRLDMAQDPCHVPFFERIPKVKWVTFENSSHSPMWEERERFMSLVEAFLQP